MDLIHEALKKAQEEGKIGPELLPLLGTRSDQSIKDEEVRDGHLLSNRRFKITNEMAIGVQMIVENIHSAILQRKTKVIGFTSALSEEGTSTIASVVSYLMANKNNSIGKSSTTSSKEKHYDGSSDNQSILLVDVQFRNPSIHEIFGASIEPGLIDLLKNKVKFNSVVRHIENSNMKLIPSGLMNSNQSWTIDQELFKDFLKEAGSKFELICLDLPSILNYSEWISFGRLCDGVILVIQAGQTSLEDIEEAKRRLEAAKVNIMGSILNRRGTFIPDSLYKLF